MANPYQKTILLVQAYEQIKVIYTKSQGGTCYSDMEVKNFTKRNCQGLRKKKIRLNTFFPLLAAFGALFPNQ